jgi:hypothetical protein
MRYFFRNWKDIHLVLDHLGAMRCPACGASGVLIRHGFNRGFVTPRRYGIRSRRIRCKRSARRDGCTRSFSLRPAGSLPRRCFSAKGLWVFIQKLREGCSIKAAWEQCGIRLSLDTGYRLYHRLERCQPVLRTRLCSRAPPGEGRGAGSALLETLDHLQRAFGDPCAVRAYQEVLQRDFLAIA